MPHHDEAGAVRPLTLAWVGRHLEVGERIVRTEALHGGITAEMRRLTIRTRDGGTRDLVLRSFVDVEHAEDWLDRGWCGHGGGRRARLPRSARRSRFSLAPPPTPRQLKSQAFS